MRVITICQKKKGIVSSLYKARANTFNDNLKILLSHMQDTPTIPDLLSLDRPNLKISNQVLFCAINVL